MKKTTKKFRKNKIKKTLKNKKLLKTLKKGGVGQEFKILSREDEDLEFKSLRDLEFKKLTPEDEDLAIEFERLRGLEFKRLSREALEFVILKMQGNISNSNFALEQVKNLHKYYEGGFIDELTEFVIICLIIFRIAHSGSTHHDKSTNTYISIDSNIKSIMTYKNSNRYNTHQFIETNALKDRNLARMFNANNGTYDEQFNTDLAVDTLLALKERFA